jgi:predicted RNase H-like nuclease
MLPVQGYRERRGRPPSWLNVTKIRQVSPFLRRQVDLNGSLTEVSSLGLVTQSINGFRSRTDKGNTSFFDLSSELVVFRKETITGIVERELARSIHPYCQALLDSLPWVNHVDTVFERDPDNVFLSQVSSNWAEALANLVRFISLQRSHEH